MSEWPGDLSIPLPQPPPDSNITTFETNQSMYEKSFKSSNELQFRRTIDGYFLQQSALYDFSVDGWTNENLQNHAVDLHGSVVKTGFPFQRTSLGLEWLPSVAFTRRKREVLEVDGSDTAGVPGVVGDYKGAFRFGPSLGYNLFDIPVTTGGGLSLLVFDTLLPDQLSDLYWSRIHHDAGFYVSSDIGDYGTPHFGAPIYFYGKINAQSQQWDKVDLVGGVGALFYAHGFASGDSLFLLVADSVMNGKDAHLGETGEKITIINNDGRLENSLMFKTGTRLKPRAGLMPGLVYTYANYSIVFWDKEKLGDVMNGKHNLMLILHTDSAFVVDYQGGLSIESQNENRLHTHDINELEEQQVDLFDYDGIRMEMSHFVGKKFDFGLVVGYQFDIMRFSRIYKDSVATEVGWLKSEQDNDLVSRNHKATVSYACTEVCSLALFGGGGVYRSHFLKASRSGNNSIDRTYNVGMHAKIRLFDSVTLYETINARANVSEYEFPEVHRDPFDPPPYSRIFSSLLRIKYLPVEKVALQFKWNLKYDDEGIWAGREYRDSLYLDTAGTDNLDKYLLNNKTWEYILDLSATWTFLENAGIEVGTEFKDVYFQEVDRGEWVANSLGFGYLLVPRIGLNITPLQRPVLVSALCAAHLDFNERLNTQDSFWEISISGSFRF
ncbi:MAG: hypothetical protein GF398_17350 [Chitinivibrionales bacterium]|nr:hypothetical protein [Chitinivibrionales bacterium]